VGKGAPAPCPPFCAALRRYRGRFTKQIIVPAPTAKPVHAPVHLRLRRSNYLHQQKYHQGN
jgi:hypothetical protein